MQKEDPDQLEIYEFKGEDFQLVVKISPAKVLTLSRTSDSDLLLSRDGIFQGPFNTTYSITANFTDFNAIPGHIKSAIMKDYIRSPTIGYIKAPLHIAGLNETGTFLPGIANPFANKTRIFR